MKKLVKNIEKLLNVIYYNIAYAFDQVIVNRKKQISLYHVTALFIRELKKNHIQSEANSVAYNFMLAIFPAIIFLFTLIPYIPITNLSELIITSLDTLLPESIYHEAVKTINDIVERPREGLLSFGFIMALFLATNGMLALMSAFNRCYRTKDKRSGLSKRLIAVLLTLLLSFVLICGVALIFTGKALHDYITEVLEINQESTYVLLRIAEYVLFLFIFLVAISTIYYFGPSLKKKWTFFSSGSIFCTFMAVFASMGFAYYINNFGTYNKVYGSIGTLIGFMIWLKLISMILLIGFEINASIDSARRGIKVHKMISYQRLFFKHKMKKQKLAESKD